MEDSFFFYLRDCDDIGRLFYTQCVAKTKNFFLVS